MPPIDPTRNVAATPQPAATPAVKAVANAPAPGFGTDTPPAPAPDLTGLTAEEAGFVQRGFLPADFAALRAAQREGGKDAARALARKGLKGPFSRRFGDPDAMLDGARRWARHPELARMVAAIKPGDILVTTWNKENDFISNATKGPFIHALICVEAGSPPEFIEALGLTGDVKDPEGNKVLRSMMAEHGYDGETVRVLRPAANLSPYEAEKAVKRAIAFAENQLGKPYDFAFTETNGKGMNDAYYCSELAYKAYAHPKGADLPIAIDKASERDEALSGLSKLIAGLKPDDAGALTFEVAQLSARGPLKDEELVTFITERVLPATEATRAIADTPARRAAVRDAIAKAIRGDGFRRFQAALAGFTRDERAGAFKGVAGFFRRVGATVGIGWAMLSDTRALTKDIGFWRTFGVAWRVAQTLVPHAETLTRFFFGKGDPRTAQARQTLDTLDGLARDARRVPLIGRFWPLPARPRPEASRDFVSPTDLGWADVPHWDFNVKANFPIDKPAVEARPVPIGG